MPLIHAKEQAGDAEHRTRDNVAAGVLLAYLKSACVFPASVAQRLTMYGFGRQGLQLSDAIERLTRSELDSPTSISRFRADVLDKRLDDIVLALADCTQRYGLKHVVFPEETYYQVKSAPLVHTDPAGRQYWLNETTGVWTKLGADYDGVDPNKAWRHTLDEADAAAVNGGDDSYDDSNLFGACSTRPACSTCVSDRRCAWCAVGQTCVVLDEGTSCRGGIEITRVAGCAAIQGEGGVLALPYAASTPAPSPAVNVEYLNLFGDAPGSQ